MLTGPSAGNAAPIAQRRRAARIAVPHRYSSGVGRYARGRLSRYRATGTTNVHQDAFRHQSPDRQRDGHADRLGVGHGERDGLAKRERHGHGRGGPPASSFANGAIATNTLGDVATTPVDGTGAAINMNQTAAQAAASMNCSLAVRPTR